MKVNEKGIEYLSNSDTICILLPGTTFYLGKNHMRPIINCVMLILRLHWQLILIQVVVILNQSHLLSLLLVSI